MFVVDPPAPTRAELEKLYNRSYAAYEALRELLERKIEEALRHCGLRATVKSRVKGFPSLYQKIQRTLRVRNEATPGSAPIIITDLVALRVVCPFLEDVSLAERCIRSQFSITEVERKGADFSIREFGYESVHCLIRAPEDLLPGDLPRPFDCEVQLRTILQDAWAEVEHELVYKADVTVFDETVQRKLAALNANLTLADITFQETRDYQRQLRGELNRRRESVWEAIAAATDGPAAEPGLDELDAEGPMLGVSRSRVADSGEPPVGAYSTVIDPAGTLDDQLLAALQAHNRGDFGRADAVYTQILARRPRPYIRAVVLIHRGMARLVSSRYRDALDDFSGALAIDPGNCRALFYRGTVFRILGDLPHAEEDFDACLSRDAYRTECLLQRAALYLQSDRLREAREDCDRALALDPDSQAATELRERVREREAYDAK